MRIVSKSLFVIGIMTIVLSGIRCDKDPVEESLRISTDASLVEITPSSSFDFNVRIESAMPRHGVGIECIVKGETDNQVYFQARTSSSSKDTRLTISNLPRQIMCVCTVVVTSVNNSSNTATTSFRIGYK